MCLIEPLVDAHAQVARPLRGSIITIIGHDEYVEIGSRIIELTEALKQAADQSLFIVDWWEERKRSLANSGHCTWRMAGKPAAAESKKIERNSHRPWAHGTRPY